MTDNSTMTCKWITTDCPIANVFYIYRETTVRVVAGTKARINKNWFIVFFFYVAFKLKRLKKVFAHRCIYYSIYKSQFIGNYRYVQILFADIVYEIVLRQNVLFPPASANDRKFKANDLTVRPNLKQILPPNRISQNAFFKGQRLIRQ